MAAPFWREDKDQSAEGFEVRIFYESGPLHARFSQFPDAELRF